MSRANPNLKQKDVVNHFSHRKEGVLKFTQSALSKKLKPEVVAELCHMRPDVDRALALWQESMEKRNESVTGAMLIEKRAPLLALRALELEEANSLNLWDIKILEAISDVEMGNNSGQDNWVCKGWEIISEYATADWTLPQAISRLKITLGNHYHYQDWEQGLNAVLNAENDTEHAVKAVHALMITSSAPAQSLSTSQPTTKPKLIQSWHAHSKQIEDTEKEMMDCVKELYYRSLMDDGEIPGVDDLVNPIAERNFEELDERDFAEGEKGLHEI
ncbi:hypothetical protein L218DRAFT_950870 [Marasmius fiardii PR-910]|nr:hypothetical protein L218DRAFT_950870 [Marasmius fiardii PR-910]